MKWNFNMNREVVGRKELIVTSPFYKIFSLVGKTWPRVVSSAGDEWMKKSLFYAPFLQVFFKSNYISLKQDL